MGDLEIMEQWGKANGGTASDIRVQCPGLKAKKVREISGMCERLVADGRLQAVRVPAPVNRYVGRSLEKSSQCMKRPSSDVTHFMALEQGCYSTGVSVATPSSGWSRPC